MAITANDNIKALLKVYYRENGVENLMFRNSPVLKKLPKTRIEGKSYNFSCMYGRGGAVAADFTKARALAATVSKNVEFSVEPGQLFSVYGMNAKEVQASQTQRGSYMRVAGAKLFASAEGFRKTLSCALWGRGFGELCFAPAGSLTAGTETITLPTDAIMKIDVGSELVIKTSVAGGPTSVKTTLNVTAINGNAVTVTVSDSYTVLSTDVVCLAGSMDAQGNPLLPVGLGGWLPVVGGRTGAAWNTYIGNTFFGVNRAVATDRLAGAFYKETSSTAKKVDAIQALLMQVRRQGSVADMICVNDVDWLEISKEIATTNTYFTQTSTKESKKAAIGYDSFSASFSTNYIESITDDPTIERGVFYILDSSAIELASLTNTSKIDDGVAGNNAGKPNPMSETGDNSQDPYRLIIDDYINVQSGTADVNGPTSEVTLMFFGSIAVTNPSVCGVGLFYGANPVGLSA